MTTMRPVVITCDFPRCNARFDRGNLDVATARKEAADAGWRNIRGLIDLCGPREKGPSWAANERDRLQGHGLGEHIPVLTPKGRHDVDVSCTCGWSDPKRWPAPRISASWYWSQHLPGQETTHA